MNKREMEQRRHMLNALESLGFTSEECQQLRRISMTLHNWHEQECGTGEGCIERDEETGKPFWVRHIGSVRRYSIPDREKGAHKRLERVVSERNARHVKPGSSETAIGYFIQTDPRGAALYILRPGDVPADESADAYYSRGICVY